MIVYKKGNIVDAKEEIIVHGCNAQGVMGSGVAKAIRDKWPEAYESYRQEYLKNGLKLGSIIMHNESDVVIANCITQENYGRDGKKYVSYDAIHKCMAALFNHCKEYDIKSIAMPKIGAGLGGGDWLRIEGIIKYEFGSNSGVTIVVYDL